MAQPRASIGVIGGSGLYQMPGLEDIEQVVLETPFGRPSDTVMIGTLADQRIAFLPRHGRGHRLLPSEIPVQANIFAFKLLGVRHLIAVSAVGSMRETIKPLDLVVPDQLIDRTVLRPRTFFGEGLVAHVGFADPFCSELRQVLAAGAERAGATVHHAGTYVCIEGPQFSTRAESLLYRQWGVDVIGMTAAPEAKLAREAEMCFAMLALVTDYDVWHASESDVTAQMVVANLAHNVETAREVIRLTVPTIADLPCQCDCGNALEHGIMTEPDRISAAVRERLAPLLGRYLERS